MKPVLSYALAAAVVLLAVTLAAMAFARMGNVRPAFVSELDNPMTLRVYDLPPERAEPIRSALANALRSNKATQADLGQVSLSGNQLVVLAPVLMQGSIAGTLQALRGETVAGSVPKRHSVRLSVWLVDAVPGAGTDDPVTAPIADALAASKPSLGEIHFRAFDMFEMTMSPNGESGRARSARDVTLESWLQPTATGVSASLTINGPAGASMKADTTLEFGRTLVLARLAASAGDPKDALMRLYVVRAEPVAAGG